MSKHSAPNKMNTALKRIGYAAMGISGVAGAVYAVSTDIRKRDLSMRWALDPMAAPPQAVQRQLRGADSENSSDDDEPPLKVSRDQRTFTPSRLGQANANPRSKIQVCIFKVLLNS